MSYQLFTAIVVYKNVDAVRAAIRAGACVNALSHGLTPLHWAVSAGDEVLVALLLKEGAHVHGKAIDGRMPLLLALGGGHPAILRLLLDAGAYINYVHDGYTPLQYLMTYQETYGRIACLRMLLAEPGLDVSARHRARQGSYIALVGTKTALEFAVGRGHFEYARLIADDMGARTRWSRVRVQWIRAALRRW